MSVLFHNADETRPCKCPARNLLWDHHFKHYKIWTWPAANNALWPWPVFELSASSGSLILNPNQLFLKDSAQHVMDAPRHSGLFCKKVAVHQLPLIELLESLKGLPCLHVWANHQRRSRLSFSKIFPSAKKHQQINWRECIHWLKLELNWNILEHNVPKEQGDRGACSIPHTPSICIYLFDFGVQLV